MCGRLYARLDVADRRALGCRDLERAVEELSELIELPIDPEVIMSLRQKVTDKTVRLRYSVPEGSWSYSSQPGIRPETQ